MTSQQTQTDPAAPGDEWVVRASFGQERIWMAHSVAPSFPVFNVDLPMDLHVPLEADDMRRAVALLTERHEALRTGLRLRDEDLQQVVAGTVVPELVEVDLSGVAESERGLRLRDELRDFAALPVPVDGFPLWRGQLVRLGADRWVVHLVLHHSICDGTSCRLLYDELKETCRALVERRPPVLPELTVQYADYAVWQREQLTAERERESLDHWRATLAGLPVEHSLPMDHPRPATPDHTTGDVLFDLSEEIVDGVARLSRDLAVTPFSVHLAAWAALVHRLSGATDIAFGVPVAGRDHPETRSVVGMFVNTVVVRVDLAGDPSFSDLCRQVLGTVLDALEHSDLPLQRLVEELAPRRSPAVAPLYQLGFNHIPLTSVGASQGAAVEDLSLELTSRRGRLVFSSALFSSGSVERLAERFVSVLEAVVAGSGVRVSQLPVLGAGEGELVVSGFNATSVAWSGRAGAGSLPVLLGGGVEAAGVDGSGVDGSGVAVLVEDGSFSYRQVHAAANRVAARLAAAGVGAESVVGVCAGRSVELVVALLGVVKAGAAFLPLDPQYPSARLGFMLADTGARVVLTQQDLAGAVSAADASVEVVGLEEVLSGAAAWADWSDAEPGVEVDPDQAAYVIYTSGSTGQPKAVVNTHRGIVNRLAWMQQDLGLTVHDRVLQKTPTSFDVSVWEFFWPLATGAAIVMARPDGHKDPTYLRELIDTAQVTTCHFVPSMLTAFLADLPEQPDPSDRQLPSLTRIICSGEALPPATAATCRDRLPHTSLHNLYGPTEAAIDVTATTVHDTTAVTIGSPVANTRILVLDPHGRPQPIGVTGHLHIAGPQLARGYHARPALTAQAFVPDPYGAPGDRLYATGDLARWRPDGTLDYLGRTDHQVKLRGQRIELGEIETTLRNQPGVTDAAVILREDTPGDQRLTAYITGTADPTTTRTALTTHLPEHLVPTTIVTLPHLPTTPNGKLDRTALPRPTTPTTTHTTPPRTPTEHLIATTWADVLHTTTPLSAHDNFFDLGGHSLLATRAAGRLSHALELRIPLGVFFAHQTVEAMAREVERLLLEELVELETDGAAADPSDSPTPCAPSTDPGARTP